MKINFPLFALSVGAFAIGTTEFAPIGLLPEIMQGINISVPQAGLIISAYAVGVMIAAPLTTLWLAQMSKRNALILLMAFFVLGSLLSAIAPNYLSLIAARVMTSLTHGAFFGIGSVVAASLVPKEQQGNAIAAMFMGLSIACIAGVPLSTWLGQHVGWRMSFVAISALGVITMLALWLALPQGERGTKPNVKQELRVLTRIPVVLVFLTTLLGFGSMFSLYTYIAPSLQYFLDASPMMITVMVALVGLGFTLGNHFGGKFANRSIDKTLIGALLLLAVTMFIFPFVAKSLIGTGVSLVVFGAAAFALTPPLQMKVMAVASDAPSLASSVNIGAFNLGNALGAAAGGLVLSLNWGYEAVSWVGIVMVGLSLFLVFIQIRFYPRNQPQVTSS